MSFGALIPATHRCVRALSRSKPFGSAAAVRRLTMRALEYETDGPPLGRCSWAATTGASRSITAQASNEISRHWVEWRHYPRLPFHPADCPNSSLFLAIVCDSLQKHLMLCKVFNYDDFRAFRRSDRTSLLIRGLKVRVPRGVLSSVPAQTRKPSLSPVSDKGLGERLVSFAGSTFSHGSAS